MAAQRIDDMLSAALALPAEAGCPPRLREAMRYAVLAGGGRVRPQLTLAVAQACGLDAPRATEAAAVAVELLHCASLVHDDLPCFDDADYRRGQPTVHVRYDAATAVLVGDGLIVHAFEVAASVRPVARVPQLVRELTRGVGASGGLVGGQAWEAEPQVSVSAYHRAKTGALFVAAVACGAISAGADPNPWRKLGGLLGEAYQVADDLSDACAGDAGKPTGVDAALGRPNAVRALGVRGALQRLETLGAAALDAIPACRDRDAVARQVSSALNRLAPRRAISAAV